MKVKSGSREKYRKKMASLFIFHKINEIARSPTERGWLGGGGPRVEERESEMKDDDQLEGWG